MDIGDRFRGCLLGLAAGDAVGAAVEFKPRGTFEPLTDMVGGGWFGVAPGQWTDDTSMALCLAESLVECGGFDPRDQMERYCRWWREGHFSSNGRCFGMGTNTKAALERFLASGDPFSGSADPGTASNGCLMRLAPVPLYFFPEREAALHYAAESARTTHAAAECLDACRLFAEILFRVLEGRGKDAVLAPVDMMFESERIAAIAAGEYRSRASDAIRGTGRVVDCLEAALWCFVTTDSFQDAVLAAANLGDDADTTAAVCGQIAGAFYGQAGIPAGWLEKLAMRDEICRLAERLCAVHTPARRLPRYAVGGRTDWIPTES